MSQHKASVVTALSRVLLGQGSRGPCTRLSGSKRRSLASRQGARAAEPAGPDTPGLRPVPGEWEGPGLLKAQAYPRLAVTPWGLAAGQSPPAWGVEDGACQWGG